jgi:hypothetical protein
LLKPIQGCLGDAGAVVFEAYFDIVPAIVQDIIGNIDSEILTLR